MVFLREVRLIFGLVVFIGLARLKGLNYPLDTKFLTASLTNDMDLTPQQVAALYKERWQIELFFKKIKQNLKIKSFIGTNENAVMNQIWTAAIVTLLIEVLRQKSRHQWTFPRLLHFVRLNLLTHKRLHSWLDYPDIRLVAGRRTVERPPDAWKQEKLAL